MKKGMRFYQAIFLTQDNCQIKLQIEQKKDHVLFDIEKVRI